MVAKIDTIRRGGLERALHALIGQETLPSPGQFARFIGLGLLNWQRRWTERERLGRLDARLLEDMGIDRATVEGELRKPFWKV